MNADRKLLCQRLIDRVVQLSFGTKQQNTNPWPLIKFILGFVSPPEERSHPPQKGNWAAPLNERSNAFSWTLTLSLLACTDHVNSHTVIDHHDNSTR
jgi:hypothetical protein